MKVFENVGQNWAKCDLFKIMFCNITQGRNELAY